MEHPELAVYGLVALVLINSAATILLIGKPRSPITGGSALLTIAVNFLVIYVIWQLGIAAGAI